MKPIDIQYQLKRRGMTQAILARKLCRTPSMISQVIYGKKRSKFIMKAIAKVLEKQIEDLWPLAA